MLDGLKRKAQTAGMDDIDRIRAFNRAWTARIGVLSRRYLDSGLGMAEVRLLHELESATGARARDLAQSLGLDEAQVSRCLARFEREGWLQRIPGADRRERQLSLTPQGRALEEGLTAASRQAIGGLLEGLGPEARAALVEGFDAAREALDPAPVDLTPLAAGDAGWVVWRHGALYAAEEGYDASFEALVAEIVAAHLRRHDPARETGWIARRAGRRLGSLFCMDDGEGVARLRLFLLEPEARGTGLGQRMLDAALGFARTAGYRRVVLWTHESHRAAGQLYARNGFARMTSTPGRAFGCDVVDETWALDL